MREHYETAKSYLSSQTLDNLAIKELIHALTTGETTKLSSGLKPIYEVLKPVYVMDQAAKSSYLDAISTAISKDGVTPEYQDRLLDMRRMVQDLLPELTKETIPDLMEPIFGPATSFDNFNQYLVDANNSKALADVAKEMDNIDPLLELFKIGASVG